MSQMSKSSPAYEVFIADHRKGLADCKGAADAEGIAAKAADSIGTALPMLKMAAAQVIVAFALEHDYLFAFRLAIELENMHKVALAAIVDGTAGTMLAFPASLLAHTRDPHTVSTRVAAYLASTTKTVLEP